MGEIKNSFSVQCRNANIAKERLKNTMLKEIKTDMRKLLNKLFEWLGYVPKVEVAKLEYSISKYETLIDQMRENREYLIRHILNGQAEAHYYWNKISENEWRFVVYVGCDRHIPNNAVKSYVSDDFEYAKLCAKELCEKLNEKI